MDYAVFMHDWLPLLMDNAVTDGRRNQVRVSLAPLGLGLVISMVSALAALAGASWAAAIGVGTAAGLSLSGSV